MDARDDEGSRAGSGVPQSYVNYMSEDDRGDGRTREAFGPNHKRLLSIKLDLRPRQPIPFGTRTSHPRRSSAQRRTVLRAATLVLGTAFVFRSVLAQVSGRCRTPPGRRSGGPRRGDLASSAVVAPGAAVDRDRERRGARRGDERRTERAARERHDRVTGSGRRAARCSARRRRPRRSPAAFVRTLWKMNSSPGDGPPERSTSTLARSSSRSGRTRRARPCRRRARSTPPPAMSPRSRPGW